PGAPEGSMQEIFINLVGQFSVSHLQVLYFFYDPVKWFDERGRPWPAKVDLPENRQNADPKLVLAEAYPELVSNAELCNLIIEELRSKALIKYSVVYGTFGGATVIREDPRSRRTTALGTQFVEFVTFPRAN